VLNEEIEIWSSLVWFCFGRSDRGRGLVQVEVWSRSGRWPGPAAGREAQLLLVQVEILVRFRSRFCSGSGRGLGPAAGREAQLLSVQVQVQDR
jgi:hypothetical protein